jgi:hypothetical protein
MVGIFHYNPNANEKLAYLLRRDFSKLFGIQSLVLDSLGLCEPDNIMLDITPESNLLSIDEEGSIVYDVTQPESMEFQISLVLNSPDPYGVYQGSLQYEMTVKNIAPLVQL